MDFTGFAGLAIVALAKQMMDLLKCVSNISNPEERGNAINGTVTIIAAWLVGLLSVFLVVKSPLGNNVLFDIQLSTIGIYGYVVFGMLAGAGTGIVHDAFKAVNRQSNYEKPRLLGNFLKPNAPEKVDTIVVPTQEIVVEEPVSVKKRRRPVKKPVRLPTQSSENKDEV